MKNILLLLFLQLYSLMNYGQQLRVESNIIKNEEGKEVEAWVAHVDQDPGDCMDSYGDFMKKVFDLKASKSSKTVMTVDKVLFAEISSLRLDQRTFFTPESGGTALAFTYSPGYDIHFGRHNNYAGEFEKCEGMVKAFVRFHYYCHPTKI